MLIQLKTLETLIISKNFGNTKEEVNKIANIPQIKTIVVNCNRYCNMLNGSLSYLKTNIEYTSIKKLDQIIFTKYIKCLFYIHSDLFSFQTPILYNITSSFASLIFNSIL